MKVRRRVVVLDTDVVRRAVIQCALPAELEVAFASSVDEVGEAEVALIGPAPGGPMGEVCRSVRERMPIVLLDERFTDEEVARREVNAFLASGFVAPPFARRPLFQALTEAVERRAAATLPPSSRPTTLPPPVRPIDYPEPPASAEKLWELFRARVEAIYRNLDRLDHYQVLEVSPQAAAPQIKQAYQLRLMEFHPDRFASHPSEDFRRKLYEITKAVTEAFRVLGDPAARAVYDADRRPHGREAALPVRNRKDKAADKDKEPR
ncbi:MAG TPA: J domain-containing protein [Polyangia bacterium]|nr:J domain-containing protein [Polyangia bacterium]